VSGFTGHFVHQRNGLAVVPDRRFIRTPALGLIPLHAHCGCDGYFDRRQGSAGSNSSAAASQRAGQPRTRMNCQG